MISVVVHRVIFDRLLFSKPRRWSFSTRKHYWLSLQPTTYIHLLTPRYYFVHFALRKVELPLRPASGFSRSTSSACVLTTPFTRVFVWFLGCTVSVTLNTAVTPLSRVSVTPGFSVGCLWTVVVLVVSSLFSFTYVICWMFVFDLYI